MFENCSIIDITPTISAQMAVFPGDQPFGRKEVLSFDQGHHLTLSSMETTMHIGAHADAPNHYHQNGVGIDQRDLTAYLGMCQVIEVNIKRGTRISVADLKEKEISAKRVLFKTNSFPNPDHWNSDFNSLSPELINYLAKKGVQLIGIDTPSVDPEDSKALESHQAIYNNNLFILEGIVLNNAEEGLYQLIALPLKIKDADASPVRAILLKSET